MTLKLFETTANMFISTSCRLTFSDSKYMPYFSFIRATIIHAEAREHGCLTRQRAYNAMRSERLTAYDRVMDKR